MLDFVSAIGFHGQTRSGRTKPLRVACLDADNEEIEVVLKLSAGCELGVENLISEAISAMLAVDLDLHIPEPHLVRIEPEFIDAILDDDVRTALLASSNVGFGSKHLPPGFTAWSTDRSLPGSLRQVAIEIFTFDALIQNIDRRPGNPNCLIAGEEIAIIDHELAFTNRLIIGWKPPWEIGSMQLLKEQGNHIFFGALSRKEADLTDFARKWELVSDARLNEYLSSLPPEWNGNLASANDAISLIKDIRDNMEACITEVRRVLE